jgi:hypothetical protein
MIWMLLMHVLCVAYFVLTIQSMHQPHEHSQGKVQSHIIKPMEQYHRKNICMQIILLLKKILKRK